ncbi:hypothetical protein M501DRAFT_1050464 [Patellaria atrata CBS 101060]|uniref:HTH psq-type domain-containing protein n=1 Tax=Patellaria atrata CBS 101060 TaxID=1346257 RepID=A0A9P4SCA0_9PEZI|nr:hypothetical protein M501DRAFT_1050464 [Patellaria atrata CBS 101060]
MIERTATVSRRCCILKEEVRLARVTCFTSQWDTPVSGTSHQNHPTSSTKSTMPLTQNLQKLRQEGRLLIATKSLQENRISSVRKAAGLYDVPKSTLHRRVHGITPQSVSNSQKRKLQLSE